jgi:two-component system phosphate regulon sensor histidine kinase PhoR
MSRWVRRLDPVVFAILALFCAAGLVVYLQHRANAALERQTAIVLQKIAEQTATSVQGQIRQILDAPVFDTLSSVNHPTLMDGRLDVVAAQFERGLAAYTQVDRFFIWTEATGTAAPGEVLFYGRKGKSGRSPLGEALPGFSRDPALGRIVYQDACRHADSQRIYGAVTQRVAGTRYDVFSRIFYVDAARERFFAMLGFVVNVDTVGTTLFPTLYDTRLRNLLEPKDGSPSFELQVLDESQRLVYGPTGASAAMSVRTPLPLTFYPEDIRPRMAAEVAPRPWTIVVSPSRTTRGMIATRPVRDFGLSALSILLMLSALGLVVRSRRRVAELARMEGDFVAHVSHQIKTSLSLVSAVSETLALDRVRSRDKLARCLDIVRTETSKLEGLVEQILDFSRARNHRRPYEFEKVNLPSLVRETVDEFGGAVSEKGYRIAVEATDPSVVVPADPAALEQALINLLDNAVKYSGESRDLTVRVGRSGAAATIEVSDRGIGMTASEQSRIFDKFYRGGGAALSRQGFGLGLAIAQELVAAHGGRIDVESAPGAGSTFRIRLPIRRPSRVARVHSFLPRWLQGRRMVHDASAVDATVETSHEGATQ